MGRFRDGGFLELLPKAFVEEDDSGHLADYSKIVGSGLDLIYEKIDNLQNLPEMTEVWFLQAWTEVLGFRELPSLLTEDELKALLPWFLRLYKLKGTMIPIRVITSRIFNDGQIVVTVLPFEPVSGELRIVIEIPVDYDASVEGVSTNEYIAAKVNALYQVLIRFVPIYCDLLIILAFSDIVDSWTKSLDDSGMDFSLELQPDSIPTLGFGEVLVSATTIVIVDNPRDGGFILNTSELQTSGEEGSIRLIEGPLEMAEL